MQSITSYNPSRGITDNRRWSSISVVARRRHSINKRNSWKTRQKRRTFPPATQNKESDCLKQKRKKRNNGLSFYWLDGHPVFQLPPTMSSQSSSLPVAVKPLVPDRFSAIYVDLEGNTVKTVYRRSRLDEVTLVYVEAGLFLFGFLFFPCWWIGALLFFKHRHIFTYLNIAFTFISLCIIVVLVVLLVWLSKEPVFYNK
ncbi:hypothetical protein RMCBS344292_15009 [Rhizopus microsporus]|nr:hypothetical protein RMCBS344292_15009 [Rhizopus microsporus]